MEYIVILSFFTLTILALAFVLWQISILTKEMNFVKISMVQISEDIRPENQLLAEENAFLLTQLKKLGQNVDDLREELDYTQSNFMRQKFRAEMYENEMRKQGYDLRKHWNS